MPRNSSIAIMPAAMFLWPNEPRQSPASCGSWISVARWIDRLRRQHYSEIADRQQRQRGDAEPAHQFVLRFRQQHHRRGDRSDAGGQREAAIDVPGSSDSTTLTHDPAAEQHEARRQQRRQARACCRASPARPSAPPGRRTPDRSASHCRCAVPELRLAEIDERPQRHPGQQQRADEGGAAHHVHHLLTAQSADDGARPPMW